jgi:hypothetical protein
VGDTYPNQHLETVVRVHFYRWRPKRKPGQSGFPTVTFQCLEMCHHMLCQYDIVLLCTSCSLAESQLDNVS